MERWKSIEGYDGSYEIRAIGRAKTQQEIADRYGVHQCTISDILLGIRMLAPETINE